MSHFTAENFIKKNVKIINKICHILWELFSQGMGICFTFMNHFVGDKSLKPCFRISFQYCYYTVPDTEQQINQKYKGMNEMEFAI